MRENINVLSEKVGNLILELDEKDKEILRLKAILLKSKPINEDVGPLIISDEEMIAMSQLHRLKEVSSQRQLTLDESRMFDLFVKNKRLAQGAATTIEAKGLPRNLETQTLLSIAKSK